MSRNNILGTSWPPRGWEELCHVKNLQAQALVKDPVRASIIGIHYKIDPIPVYLKNNKRSYVYHLNISGWNYSIQNESHEYQILSFYFQECFNASLSKDNFISDIKTKSRPLFLNERSATRSLMAAIFMIKQIESGQVPDYNRILRLYKIHPSQRSLYELDYRREDSLNCGLATYCFENAMKNIEGEG